MVALRSSMAVAGMFKNYSGSGLSGMILCEVVDSGTLREIGIYGGKASMVVHTLYCYWKVVHPVHHRKYYRRWVVHVGLVLPMLLGVVFSLTQALATTGIINGTCIRKAYLPSDFAFKVQYALHVCTRLSIAFCTLHFYYHLLLLFILLRFAVACTFDTCH